VTFVLTVTPAGAGVGVVSSGTSSPAIDCGSTCTASFAQGSMVTLTAAPSTGSTFTGWSGGGCTGAATTCTVTMSAAETVTATFALQTYTLSLSKNFIGASTGSVSAAATGTTTITCGSTCSNTYPYGTVVTLQALPGTGYYLQGFTGGLTSTSYAPTLTITGNATVTATFTPPNDIFVSTMDYTGDIGGLSAANLECNNEASADGIPGDYVAWMSTSTVNASSLFPNARGWVRPDGLPFGDSVVAITGTGVLSQVFYPPRLDALGKDVGLLEGAEVYLATGTYPSGTVASGFTCGDWTNTTGNSLLGLSDAGNSGWTYSVSSGCSPSDFHLLCMGTDYYAVIPPPTVPTGARYIFLANGPFSPASGYAGAKTICQNEAQGVLPGTYLPLLATASASAASAFTARDVPVVRPDGVVVATSDSAFLTGGDGDPGVGPIQAPIEVSASGVHGTQNSTAFTGAATVTTVGTMATTCNNWSTNSGAITGTSGLTNLSYGTIFFNDTLFAQPACSSTTIQVYCLEQ
jgi:hypothetical protein